MKLGIIIATVGIIGLSLFISESAYAELDYCRYVATIKICNSVIPEENWINNYQLSINQMNIINDFFNTPKIFDTQFTSQNNYNSRHGGISQEELETINKILERQQGMRVNNAQSMANYDYSNNYKYSSNADMGTTKQSVQTTNYNGYAQQTIDFNPYVFEPKELADPTLNFQTTDFSPSSFSIPSASNQNTHQNSISINYASDVQNHWKNKDFPLPTTLNTKP